MKNKIQNKIQRIVVKQKEKPSEIYCNTKEGATLKDISWKFSDNTPPPSPSQEYHNIWVFPFCFTKFSDKTFIKKIRTCNLLYEIPSCYHRASKIKVRERIFKLNLIHASVICQIPWIHLNFFSILRESPFEFFS